MCIELINAKYIDEYADLKVMVAKILRYMDLSQVTTFFGGGLDAYPYSFLGMLCFLIIKKSNAT